jgi:hypothetical protein
MAILMPFKNCFNHTISGNIVMEVTKMAGNIIQAYFLPGDKSKKATQMNRLK